MAPQALTAWITYETECLLGMFAGVQWPGAAGMKERDRPDIGRLQAERRGVKVMNDATT